MRPISRLLRNQWSQPPMWAHDHLNSLFVGLIGEKEKIGDNFEGYVHDAYRRDGVVFACIAARLLVFSEARFLWRERIDGQPGELFWDESLRVLEQPAINATTGDLLARMEQNVSLAGNYYGARIGNRVRSLRPDWVTIITGSESGGGPYAVDAEPVAYSYQPPGKDPTLLTPDEVIHYNPIPDPAAQWRGMSWLTPVLTEIKADLAATRHKLRFFENGAVPGIVISYDESVGKDAFEFYVEKFRKDHEGADKAYKTLHLGGGADASVVGANLEQLDFKATQGAGETRIASAAGVHPVIVGLSEGLAGSSLNAGNFAAARRRFADGTIRPMWRSAAGAAQSILPPPTAVSELWYDDGHIAFLRQDAKEEAEIDRIRAQTISRLVESGFTAESALAAVTSGDFSRLEHSGLFSVQLQPLATQTVDGLVEAGFTAESALAAVTSGDFTRLQHPTLEGRQDG